jgi:hypothetical protein
MRRGEYGYDAPYALDPWIFGRCHRGKIGVKSASVCCSYRFTYARNP